MHTPMNQYKNVEKIYNHFVKNNNYGWLSCKFSDNQPVWQNTSKLLTSMANTSKLFDGGKIIFK